MKFDKRLADLGSPPMVHLSSWYFVKKYPISMMMHIFCNYFSVFLILLIDFSVAAQKSWNLVLSSCTRRIRLSHFHVLES